MTTAIESPTVEERLDAISGQLSAIAAELDAMRKRRDTLDEFRATVAPIADEAYQLAARELEKLTADGTVDDVVRLVRRLVASAGALERGLAAADTMASLAGEAAPLTGEAFAALTARLAEYDRKGYFEFMRHAAGVLDRVVTSFDGADIDQLGDNVVLILQTVKEMTQPEVMTMLRRTASAVQSQQHVIDQGEEGVPSLRTLMRKLRNPEVRRGLARAIDMLQIVAADPGPQEESRSKDMEGDG